MNKLFQIGLLALGFGLLAFQLFQFFWFDSLALQKKISAGVPARFIQANEETIDQIQQYLKKLEPIPPALKKSPKAEDFGREILFLP